MEVHQTEMPDIKIIKPKVFGDERGYFFESYSARIFEKHNLKLNFVQDNQSYSKYGTLRGIHYQKGEFAQTKLVRVLKGKILDVAVDIRKGSPTYGKHVAVELSDDNFLQLLVPKGFAHGFIVLSENAIVAYKCDSYYAPDAERGIIYNDPDLNINWQVPEDKIILSARDKVHPKFKDLKEV